ncbi:MAG: hypothetical protein AB1625_08595 [Acidobacteriota bacterium]
MTKKAIAACVLATVAAIPAALALHPDDEMWIPAAARGQGKAGSFWMTDLVVMNLGEEAVTVEVSWLERDADNREAEGVEFVIGGGATLTLEDVVLSVFGLEEAYGALHVEVVEEEEEEGSPGATAAEAGDDDEIIAHARVYSRNGSLTVGQGLEGFTSAAIISADREATTHVIGASDDGSYRSNWYGQNTSEEATEVIVELLDAGGEVIAAGTFTLAPLAPVMSPLSDLGEGLGDFAVRFTVTSGEGIFGVSKVDRLTNDPTTLEPHWECDEGDEGEFTDEFSIDACTFATTGSNPFFILQPGYRLILEGEEDGEEVEVIITVLAETEAVDGVETRVLEERESVDGELVEVSRNFMAVCVETGDVFYFGEDVDIYDGGEIVGHDGAWRAGEGGAKPGIVMPGRFLLGARYYQEIAPGVALDRAENVAMGLEVTTAAGTFEDCVRVDETSPLEPGDVSVKIYAPGAGLIFDDGVELAEVVNPAAP